MNHTCIRCDQAITGYVLEVSFILTETDRIRGLEEVRLSCGCSIYGPDFDVEEGDTPGSAFVTITDIAGTPVLTFEDRFEEHP